MTPASTDHVAAFTSTGSKRPESLFGTPQEDLPSRMVRASGCRVWDDKGRQYTDYIMGLGAVALGYGDAEVGHAAIEAIRDGVVGPLAPALEEEVAARICRLMPWIEQLRFHKTGAEAMAAAVRLARVSTGRERIIGCGYHGWLDWCQAGRGVPASTRALYSEIPFNDAAAAREMIRGAGDSLAAVVFEPVILREPDSEWLAVLRSETERVGAFLIIDEIKTVCRLEVGGACERYRIRPDLAVMGKAIANGFPLAAVGGRRNTMAGVSSTWISSTLATEFVSLAAAQATLDAMVARQVPRHLGQVGSVLLKGLHTLRSEHPDLVTGVAGIPEMCFLQYTDDVVSQAVTAECARAGVLFKRSAYNFVSLAHDVAVIEGTLQVLAEALSAVAKPA